MKIYLVNGIDALDESFIEKCISFFPTWRREQLLAHKHHKGKIQNGLGYLLLIHALREEGVFHEMPDFRYNEHGKPFLKNYPDWYFSISHSRNAVCCIIAKKDIGIDIEEIREYKEPLAKYSCNDKEMSAINQSKDKADEFYKLWTKKEAAFKLIGTGITKDIKNILEDTHINIISKNIENIWLSVATEKDNNL